MIRRAIEGELTWLQGLDLLAIPRPLPASIQVILGRGEVGIQAQGLVGAIPLLNGDTLQIVPKIGLVNFLRLLFRAEGNQHDLGREYDEFVEYSVEDQNNTGSIVARQLTVAADRVLSRSPLQGRRKRQMEGPFVAGQVDALKTASNIACHKDEPVAYSYKERTSDIPENRVITEALLRVQPLLEEADRATLGGICDRWLARFPRSAHLDEDMGQVQQGFATAKYGGPRDYYRKTLMLCQVVLGSFGLGFRDAASIEGDAVLLNSAIVFENYLRAIISTAYSGTGHVVSRGGVGSCCLYMDGSYGLVPDIVVSKDSRTLLICDAKYKEPSAADHYQMHTYLSVYGVHRGLLLTPGVGRDEVFVRERATASGEVVWEAYLPMSDLTKTEGFLRTVVQRFAEPV